MNNPSAITVAKLINLLESVKNKDLKVFICNNDTGWDLQVFGINVYEDSVYIQQASYGQVKD